MIKNKKYKIYNKNNIKNTNIKIEEFQNKENELKEKYKEIQFKIKNITPKYEKAANYAHNYTADSIILYFSNLK
jgi:molecular chaperone GrpE (heat shock protein)